MKTIRWGILSTAKIGTVQVIPAIQNAENCEVVGIASRSAETAAQAASELGITNSFGSYEELLACSEVDAIYNPLPNHLHVDWSIKAIQAGKHVLCEKPLGLDVADANRLVEAAAAHPKLKVMEAFMYRHHPQWQKAKELVTSGELGKICTINSVFSYYNRDPGNIRNQPGIGGGGLMDIGCYPISLSRFLFDREPERVIGTVEFDPDFKVDRFASAILDFGSATATFSCSTQMVPYQRVNIFGTEGRFEIEIPFNAPIDRPCRTWLQKGEDIETIDIPICNQYTIQAELFASAILDDTPVPTPLRDAIGNMQVIESILKSAEKNEWIEIK